LIDKNKYPVGSYLYRLFWIDHDGTYNYMGVLSFTVNGFAKLYSNPTKSNLNLEYYSDTEPDIYIYDLNGKEILKLKGDLNNLVIIDISNLESGIYFLHYQNQKFNALEKFVIQK